MDKDAVDRGLERLLIEEREKAEIEMRMGIARARLAAGDDRVSFGEMWGDPYDRISAIRDVMVASGLGMREAKPFVDAYKWDRNRTIEAAVEAQRGKLPRLLDLKPDMRTKQWIEIREAIEAEPDLEIYRRKKLDLYLYLLSRAPQYVSICEKAEDRIERRRWGPESTSDGLGS